jgi:hypothetical protein
LAKSDTGVAKIAVLLGWALSGGLVFHERSKHIDLRYHFIRECLDDRRISVDFIDTKDQLVDTQTKALGRVRFLQLCVRIGVVYITPNQHT